MGRGKTISNEVRKQIVKLYSEGKTQIEISKSFSLNKSIISRIIKAYKKKGDADAIRNPGRPQQTSNYFDKKIVKVVRENPFLSSSKISAVLKQYGEVPVSTRTIRRRLLNAGFMSRRPAKKPLLSKKNIKARLVFAKSHITWTVNDWRRVIFSDESKFNLVKSDGICHVRRPKGERLNPKYTIATVKHGGGSVMVWGCFSWFKMGPLHRIHGIMDKYVYKDILETKMEPYAYEIMPLKHQFQHDNDPKHKSKFVADWLRTNKIDVMEWPSQSPDLNPIENMWEILDRKIRHKTYKNSNELFQALVVAWNQIDRTIIDRLIESMSRRCRAVIDAKGYHTRY